MRQFRQRIGRGQYITLIRPMPGNGQIVKLVRRHMANVGMVQRIVNRRRRGQRSHDAMSQAADDVFHKFKYKWDHP